MKTHNAKQTTRRFWPLVLIAILSLAVSTGAQTTIVWQDNLEGDNVWDNWSVDNGVWEIGAPTAGPATNSAGYRTHEGTNCAATVLAGNYPASTSSRLIRNIFVVPSGVQNPRLEFWHWYQFSGNSYGVVQIRIGTTGTWVDLSPRYYASGSGVWTRPVVDLSAYAGKAVQIGFRIAADGSVNVGWDVDEVRVIKGPYQTIIPNVAESFELGSGDWYAETGTWEVGVPTYGPATNALGWRTHSGTNCLATVLGGNYEDDRSSRLISPAFVVPSADQLPRLRFWEWFSIGGHDLVQVQIKGTNGVWQALGSSITLDSFGRWTRAWHDLTAYAGQTVQLGFYYEAHGYQYYSGGAYHWGLDPGPGWYVDDVIVETGPLPSLTLPEGFENAWGGWQVDYIGGAVTDFGIWEIGEPTYGPLTNAVGFRAHSGTNCAATVLNGNYPDDRSARLVSPAFVVPQVGAHPTLRFWHWFSIGGHDFCELQIKPEGSIWQTIAQHTGNSSVWSQPSYDLSQYAGQLVQLGFYFEAHGYQYYSGGAYHWGLDPGPGWYVDDIQITSAIPPIGIVEFTAPRYFINEGGGSATISVARKYGSAGAVDVTYVATDGTAVGGDDFDSVVDTLGWADGEQGVKTFTVPIHQDALVEGNETVTLELIVPGSLVSSVARETATLVIVDDDGVLPLSTNIAYLRSLVVPTNYVATNTTSLFTVDGTVTTYTNLSTTPADELFFMQDNTNGIAVLFRGGTNQFMPQAGDRLRVTATLTNINGLLALAPNFANITNVVWRLTASNALPTPGPLDFAARTNVPVMEAMEAGYVSAAQVMIDQTGSGTFPTALSNLIVTNASGLTFNVTIHPNTDLAGQPKPAGPVTILGVLNQNDSIAPHTTNYALLPTRYADIITAPTITGQPQSRTNGIGTTATFTVSAVGTDLLYYQWRRAGTNLLDAGNVSGAAGSVLVLANVQSADAMDYTVVVTNYLGSVTSSVAALTVVVPVAITTQPLTQTVDAGTDVTFTVAATGSAPFTYQWFWNDAPLSGATNAMLVLTAVPTNWSGNFHVVVNNAANLPTNSSTAMLTVIQVPVGDPVPPDGVGFGSFTKTNNVYTVIGGGEDIEGTEDRFFFVHLPWTGDGEIMANLKSLVPVDPQSEAGLMFRDGRAGGARHVFLAMDAGQNTIFRRRVAENAYSVENGAQGTNNVWLKLMRMGDTFIGHYSTNGVNWELVWWTTQPQLPATLEVGLAVTAHHNGEYATATFEMVGPRNLTPLSGPWPAPGPKFFLGGEAGGMAEFQRVGGFKALVRGVVGDRFAVRATGDLSVPVAAWLQLGTVTNTYGVVPFADSQALTNTSRYYQLERVGP